MKIATLVRPLRKPKSVQRFRTLCDQLEPRLQFCLLHMPGDETVLELRPDLIPGRIPNLITDTGKKALLKARSASGDASDPADIVWINRGTATAAGVGDSDLFGARFGASAPAARAVVDAVIVAYERMIGSFNYGVSGVTYSLTVSMAAAGSGFGASAGLSQSFANKPKAGSISMGAGNGSGGANGWFLDPTPFESSEFEGNIVNEFSGDAQSGSPASGKGDFFTVVAAELTHCMGLFGNALPGWTSHTSATSFVDTAEGGGIGSFWTFNGPSISHLLTSNNGGSQGQDFSEAIHSAGPITRTVGGVVYNGAQDQGNAVYEGGRRYLINNTFALMFKDAYGFASVDPAAYGTFYSTVNSTTKQVLVRGGSSSSADNISITRSGATITVSVDVGNDVAGTGALPGPGNLPAFVTTYNTSEVNSIVVQGGDQDDTITLGADLGVTVSVDGGSGTDTLRLTGGSGDDAFAFAGTTAVVGATTINSINAVESFDAVGNGGNDTLTLDGTAGNDSFAVTPGAFSGARNGTFSTIETIVIRTLGGPDTVSVNAPLADVTVDVGADGGDTLTVLETAPGFTTRLADVAGTASSTLSLNTDDTGSASFNLPVSQTIGGISIGAGGTVDGPGDLNVVNSFAFLGGTIGGGGIVSIASGADAFAGHSTVKNLNRPLVSAAKFEIDDGGTLVVAPGLSGTLPVPSATAFKVEELELSDGGTLDLTNNVAIIDYDGSSPIGSIAAAVTAGYAAGTWTGSGIRSSTAASQAADRVIGYAEATDVLQSLPGDFAGTTLDTTSIVLRYTVAADANLNGTVDFDDLVVLSQNYNSSGKTFSRGNFNFDAAGTVDFDDLVVLSQHYNQSLQSGPSTSPRPLVALVNVPSAPVKKRKATSTGGALSL